MENKQTSNRSEDDGATSDLLNYAADAHENQSEDSEFYISWADRNIDKIRKFLSHSNGVVRNAAARLMARRIKKE